MARGHLPLKIDHFLTVTLGIVVLFVGKRLNQVVPLFREFRRDRRSLVCILFTVIYLISGVGVEFIAALALVSTRVFVMVSHLLIATVIFIFDRYRSGVCRRRRHPGWHRLASRPSIARKRYGISGAMEIGIACATFSRAGQRRAIQRDSDEPVDVGIKEEEDTLGAIWNRACHSYLHHHRRPV